VIRLLASIPSPSINAIEIGPLRLTFYGLFIAIGTAIAWRMTVNRYAARGGNPEIAEKILIRMVIFGFLGARAAYVSTHLGRFEGELWKVIAIWEGGLALFGGLTAGAITLVVLLRRWGGDLGAFTDSLAPSVPVAQALGRWGNYFNQELFGTPTDLPWGLEIAPPYRPEAYPDAETFHPTFLYESIWNLGLAAFIVLLDRRYPSLRGRLIGIYFAGYALMRFLLELIRTDTTFRLLGLSRNGWVSIGAVLIGLVIVFRGRPLQLDTAGAREDGDRPTQG
jgi:prolipoprotein diacylglyceryl transferase